MASTLKDEKVTEPRDEAPDRKESSEKKPLAYKRPDTAQGKGPGFFTIYKKGQGYWTRMGTAMGAALIVALTVWFFYQQLPPIISSMLTPAEATPEQMRAAGHAAKNVTMGISAALLVGLGLLCWRLMNKPTSVDFLIATDSEMKKVNWTSRKELIGSTKVVIFFMFLIAAILFAVDIVFGFVFHWIHVLDAGPFG